MTGKRQTSEALARRAARGSQRAAGALFERHWADAVGAAHAVTRRLPAAEDAAQEAFILAFGALDDFDDERPFWPWLRRIVINRAIDMVRRQRSIGAPEELETIAAPEGTPLSDPRLLCAIDTLTEERRVVVLLRFGLDLTPTEIAATLDIPVGTVKSRLARALDQLATRLEETDELSRA